MMKFAFALLSIAAALRSVGAGPVAADCLTEDPYFPVAKLYCDGGTKMCTAFLDYGDGNWVAQWMTTIFHLDQFGYLTEEPITSMMAPVAVTRISCNAKKGECTGNLKFNDGRWFAQWSAVVVDQALFNQEEEVIDTTGVVTKLTCNSYECNAYMKAEDLVAQWDISVSHKNRV